MGTFLPGNTNRVDPRLVSIIKAAAEASPYTVKITSGYRDFNPKRPTPNHPGGWATDVAVSSDGGKTWHSQALGSRYAAPYQDFARYARQAQTSMYPELTKTFRWGGHFSGKYAHDNEHFDITPGAKGAMALGNWDSIIAGHPVPPMDIPNVPATAAAGQPTSAALRPGMFDPPGGVGGPKAAPGPNAPVMYGLQGNRGDVNPAMKAYAESQGYRYVPVGKPGASRAEQTAALMAATKGDPSASVIAFSQGVYAARDALKQGAHFKDAMIIGADDRKVESQFSGVNAKFIQAMPGVDHMDLPAAVAKQFAGNGGPATGGGPIHQLQQQLADAGYKVNVDGQYGPQTAAAVRAFEQSSGLPVDRGVAGPQVQQRLAGNTATGDIMSARAIAPGGPGAVPDANPQDIAFGRVPQDVPSAAAASVTPYTGVRGQPGGSRFPFGVPQQLAFTPHARGGPDEVAGSGGLTSGGPPSQMPTPPFELNGSLVAGGGVPGASATMAMGASPPPVSPDPNQFGPDMAFLQRLSQPMDETLPASVPGGPAEQPSPYQNRSFWALAGGLGQRPSSPGVSSGGPQAFDVNRFASEPDAGGMAPINQPAGGTSINDVIAGVQGIPGALGGAVMGGLGGASDWLNAQLSGGISTSTATPLPPPAVSPGASYADDHYGAGLSARPYPSGVPYSPQRQSSIGGFGGIDFMPGNAGADLFGPAGGEPPPLTPGGAGYTFLPGGIPQGQPGLQFDALPAYTPPQPVSLQGSPIDQAKQYAAAAQSSDRGGYGGGYRGPPGGNNYASTGGNGVGNYAAPNWSIYPGGPGGSAWSPSGYSPESHTPYINNTGETTVDQRGNVVNVGHYSMNGVTHSYTY